MRSPLVYQWGGYCEETGWNAENILKYRLTCLYSMNTIKQTENTAYKRSESKAYNILKQCCCLFWF